jgi:hypothetical protein
MEDRMTSKLVVNTIESDTGISSVSFASSISMSSTSKFFFSAAGIDIGADTNINRPEAGVLGFNINSSEKVRIDSNGRLSIGGENAGHFYSGADNLVVADFSADTGISIFGGSSNKSFIAMGSTTFGTGALEAFIEKTHGNNNPLTIATQIGNSNIVFKSANDFVFSSYSGPTERVRITSTGQFVVGTNPTVSSGNIVHIEAPTSFNSGETIVNIEGNNAAAAARIVLHNNNTGGSAYNEILGADAGGQSTSSIRFYNTDQSNNYGEIAFGTRDNAGAPPADRMRISKEGYVTQAQRPAFDAGLSTGAVSATNPIVFNNAQVNRANCYNTSNGRFTAPITGLYFFYYGGLKNNNSNVLRLKLRKGNGTYLNNAREFRLDEQGGNYAENASMCIIVSLTANEYVQVYVTEGTVYGQYNSYTYFGGYLLA